METVFNATLLVLPIMYTLLVVAYARVFTRRSGGLENVIRPLLLGTVLLHFVSILLRSVSLGSCPLGSQAEFLSLVALSISLTYLLVELRIGERSTGVFAITPAFLLQVIASVSILGPQAPRETDLGGLDSLHVFSAIVGLSAVAICGVYAVLYLFLYGAIKRGRFGLYYKMMPPLDTLSDLNFVATCVAFLALSVTVALGLWAHLGGESEVALRRPEIVLTTLLWLLYGSSIVSKRFFRLGGKRLAYATALGLVLLLCILVGGFLAEGFHA